MSVCTSCVHISPVVYVARVLFAEESPSLFGFGPTCLFYKPCYSNSITQCQLHVHVQAPVANTCQCSEVKCTCALQCNLYVLIVHVHVHVTT